MYRNRSSLGDERAAPTQSAATWTFWTDSGCFSLWSAFLKDAQTDGRQESA